MDKKIEKYYKDEDSIIQVFHKFYTNSQIDLTKEDFPNLNISQEHLNTLKNSRKSHYFIVGKFGFSLIATFFYCYRRSKKLKSLGLSKNNYINWGIFTIYTLFGLSFIEKTLNQKIRDDISGIILDLNFSDEIFTKDNIDRDLIEKRRNFIKNKLNHYKHFNAQNIVLNKFM